MEKLLILLNLTSQMHSLRLIVFWMILEKVLGELIHEFFQKEMICYLRSGLLSVSEYITGLKFAFLADLINQYLENYASC